MKSTAIARIEEALKAFPPDEQEQLGADFVSYLARLRELEDALEEGERDIAAGRVVTLDEFKRSIDELRRHYAGE